ncbi:heavy-metal-associated domain-containing protein [Arsenicicoccus dermatophilus]|uniref:heavy-metal-associated domain-containing protein n=1 Tax=Arsenicicoccus dermatophilus TaxID=1076331 RepID=UPI001F4D0B22|nr:cation transporter [Arsenicicoccus dermatophilus]MCH8611539.1 cation transporter [Arsenicicoccus dermatophilus]
MSQTTTITVNGMTCGHCTSAVTSELKEVAGVQDVQIDLVAGGDSPVTITSEGPLDPAAVKAAVDEAGYTVVE